MLSSIKSKHHTYLLQPIENRYMFKLRHFKTLSHFTANSCSKYCLNKTMIKENIAKSLTKLI